MATLWQDVRYGFRMLRKSPGFTAIALITLAVGIGANTIMFSLVDALLFRPPHVKEPDRLVYCGIRNFGFFDYRMYLDMRDDNPVFSDLIAHNYGGARATWVQGDTARQVSPMYVSANYFMTLGVTPAYGRTFLPEEERRGAEPVVVLSYRIWQRQGADPGIVGQYVRLNAAPCKVIGVAPKGFTGTAAVGPDLWLPLGTYGLIDHYNQDRPEGRRATIWDHPPLQFIGRLKPGLDIAGAQLRIQALVPRVKENNPRRWRDNSQLYLARLARLSSGEDAFGENRILSIVSTVLMGISGVVLLIACLNLGNMITVQGAARQREIAIRMAIGGGRWRIIRQLFVESMLLALLGGILALIPAFWGVRILNAWMVTGTLPVQVTTSFDVRVLGVTLGFCLIATVLFGMKPALRLSRRDVVVDLKESGGGVVRATCRRWRFVPRGLSVICQIALSVVLVMGATLFARTALKTARTGPGFSLAGKLVVKLDPLAGGYTRVQAGPACEALAERLQGSPGIQAVGLSKSFPVGDAGCGYADRVIAYAPGVEDETSESLVPKWLEIYTVNGDYFQAMGIPLLGGRPFRRLDSEPEAEKVAIIDEFLARKLRPDGDAVGCLIAYGFGALSEPCRVIGVVPNLHSHSGDPEGRPHLYEPMPADRPATFIHVRAAGTGPQAEATLLRNIATRIREIDPRLSILSVTGLADQHRNGGTVRQTELTARLASMFGTMALFLAGLGLYAVKGHMVASRTPEIGIRMALGATRRDILRLVFRQGAVSTVVGLSLGILLAAVLMRLIRSGLYGVSPVDPLSIGATVVLLAATSLLAGFVPARRAARIDPMVALRYE